VRGALLTQGDSNEQQLASLMSFARQQTFVVAGTTYVARGHSTLLGHEDWVHSVAWAPHSGCGGQGFQLLSASMDRTMMIWEHDGDSGLWMCVQSMGDAGRPQGLARTNVSFLLTIVADLMLCSHAMVDKTPLTIVLC
jgi:WD40 repeat protein